MSLSDQFDAMQSRAASMRREMFRGVTVNYDKGRFIVPGYSSSIRKGRKVDIVGFVSPHDCVVRISKQCGFVPEINKSIKITFNAQPDQSFDLEINEFPLSQAGVEWALGCESVN